MPQPVAHPEGLALGSLLDGAGNEALAGARLLGPRKAKWVAGDRRLNGLPMPANRMQRGGKACAWKV